eukprot:10098055-Lingulodinium_polyedra.AAC.1
MYEGISRVSAGVLAKAFTDVERWLPAFTSINRFQVASKQRALRCCFCATVYHPMAPRPPFTGSGSA